MAVWRLETPSGPRLARGPVHGLPLEWLADDLTVDDLLAVPGAFADLVSGPTFGEVPSEARVLVPLMSQDVWAAGVTYRRSRDARKRESDLPDAYDLVYDAERPELFLKATPGRAVGPHDLIGVRVDSGWDVPEPELGLVIDSGGRLVAYTIGNDVSSRSIEGENALYLPQAKVYTASCAVGPCLVPIVEAPPLDQMRITLAVERGSRVVYTDEVSVSDMKRTVEELMYWLYLAHDFPFGCILLTGTAIVPEDDFTLTPGDQVRIAITGLGELVNTVQLVGRTTRPS